MKPKKLKAAFCDGRGAITDLLDDVDLNSVTLITSKKGVVRGNHYHKRTDQWTYVLKGRIRYASRRGKGKISIHTMGPGELVLSAPGESHAILALSDAEFLVLSKGPRHGKDYELDTFRLAAPILKPARRR